MTFKPGQSGNPHGRPPKKLLKRPDEVLADMRLNPIEEVLKLIPELSLAQQAKTWLEILPYVAAKLKEAPADPDDLSELSNQELIKLVKEKFPELEKVA